MDRKTWRAKRFRIRLNEVFPQLRLLRSAGHSPVQVFCVSGCQEDELTVLSAVSVHMDIAALGCNMSHGS
jgi:hypothetical protein